ncbi:hypothetical protein FRC17_003298 [Serendipita sp. 399]|nr:hypothetical protein FRC17_003298 [Serendipita sp. 399]
MSHSQVRILSTPRQHLIPATFMPKSPNTSKTVPIFQSQPISWPQISTKSQIDISVVEPGQIIVLENFLTQSECASFVQFVDSLDLELTPAPKRGEATRVNQRASIQSESFAATLFEVLSPHLPPDFPSFQKHLTPSPRPVLCNPNIRLYKYTQGQYFGPHYDDSVAGPSIPVPVPVPIVPDQTQEVSQCTTISTDIGTSTRNKQTTKRKQAAKARQQHGPSSSTPKGIPTWSEWTILIYLTGQEDGITGGQTVFYVDEGIGKNRIRREVIPPLKRGSVLLHR